ncbi:SDR family NAD(P)-dependent oxidoreductase [Rhizobium sp. KAs_5_22]|uniref:SDR family oxidoreductase n=1 Tax=Ciceribacter selenitireducens TaxID=448181 RepID=UPI00048C7565|nr:SDR family oxidoreductase [Ciceribacter selenitireducens]PPJ46217.1 SDR family NAD(P)-dependent oxidoreductase [Rhizobium sp. KAs_5_22]
MSKILVTGAAGHLGRLIIKHLIESQKVAATDIVAGSRDTAKLADLAALGLEPRRVDFDDKASLEVAFSGIDRLLIVSTDELGTPGKRLAQHSAAVEAAKTAGVGRIFYTSMPQPEDSEITFKGDHLGTEQAIKASGLAYTIFRNGWYMENLFMSLPQAIVSGHWYTSAGNGRIAHIAREDIARAIAAGLAKPAEGNVTYTLTGETAYTTEEIAALVRDVTGKPLAVVNLTDAQLSEGMAAAGVPAPFIPTFVSFDANTREGKIAMATADAETLSGAKRMTLKAFLEVNKAALG